MSWILKPTIVSQSHNYIKWRLECWNDANALSATDILSETYMPRDMRTKLQGLTCMRMKIDPLGSSGDTLATTIDITLSDAEGDALYTTTTNSASVISWHDLSTDVSAYWTIFDKLYLTVNDLGDALAEDFYLYFICWKENA